MKNYLCLIAFCLSAARLFALPEGSEVVSGCAKIQVIEGKHAKVVVSDKAILRHKAFNINEGESIEFIQPSSKATVLNRVSSQDPSKILGNLNANGRVFLINPNGILFGPNSVVNTGAFVASTLNIRDEDFIAENYRFFRDGTAGSIVNEGEIRAEEFIALLGSVVQNRGSILADASKVLLGSGERVALDFTGDGLIRFTVEGDLENALIENYGLIEGRGVELTLRAAKKAIQNVVNTDGIEAAVTIEESNGVIRLLGHSSILAKEVVVQGEQIEAKGKIDASNETPGAMGGIVHLFGDQVELWGADINASGDSGGGTVLIGGDYQGKGVHRNAMFTLMDEHSRICADAYAQGQGGHVILWADDTTLFDGKIYARGGLNGGNGGFVETSGKENLGVGLGYVNTSAPLGNYGDWLLDPNTITIANAGRGTIAQASAPNCATGRGVSISVATMQAAASNVALCAQSAANSSITVNNAFVMPAGISLSMTAGSANAGLINLNANISTRGQPLSFTGLVRVGANITLDTTNAGGSAGGANISFSNTINGSGARTLVLQAGTGGVVTMSGAVGGTTALTSLTVTGATINQNSTAKTTGAISYTGSTAINVGGNMTTSGGTIGLTGPVVVSGTPTFDTTNAGGTPAGATITFSSTLDGATAVTFRAGTAGNVIFGGIVGGTTPPTNLVFTSAAQAQIANNITVSGANPLNFSVPVLMTGTSNITSTNANITFGSTLNGAQALTITGGSGTTTFTAAVGGTTPLSSLNATAATITQSSTAKTTGAINYTGSTAINVSGNMTTSGGTIGLTGPVVVSGAPTFDTTNAGGSPAGATITFSGALNGATVVTLRAGTAGNVIFGGIVGGTTPPTNLVFTSAAQAQIANNITVSGANPLNFSLPVLLTGTSNITSTNANITFGSTLNGAQALTVTGGSGTTIFTGAIGGTTPLSSLSAAAATITQSSTAKTTGSLAYSGSTAINLAGNLTTSGGTIGFIGPVNLNAAITMDTSNGGGTPAGNSISFSSTINGAQTLSLNGGTGGTVTMTGAIGGTAALTSLTATGATITQSSTAKATGAISYTGSTAINVAGNVTTSGGTIGLTGPVNLNAAVTMDTTNGGGTPAGNSISFSSTMNGAQTLSLNGGTGGTVTTTGAVGGITALTSLTATGATITQSSTAKTTGAISYTGSTAINLAGNVTTGGGTIGLTGPVNINASLTMDATNGGAVPAGNSISFSNTINGAVAYTQDLTLRAGSGNITFSGAVGGTIPLRNLTIVSANNWTAVAMTVATITQTAGSGTTTFNGAINTNGIGGIVLTGTTFNWNANITTTNAGPLTITHTGTLTIGAGITLNISGPYNDAGPGPTVYSGGFNIITNNANVTFSNPVVLLGSSSVNTGAGVGDILFSSTVDGNQNLTLTSGLGNITFVGGVGQTTPLNVLSIPSANNVTIGAFKAASFTQAAGTGTTTFNGAVVLSGAAGFSFTGNNLTINSSMSTAAGGSATIVATGTVVLGSSSSLSLDGAFTESGGGTVQSAGSITTTNDTIQFGDPVALTGNTVLNTGPGIGDIIFSSTLQGSGGLTLTAGTGNVTFTGAAGGSTRLGALLINSATNINTAAVSASSINMTCSNTATLTGAYNTNGAGGIQITSNTITRSGTLTTTGGGSCTFTNGGTLTSTGDFSVAGSIVQNGAGPVSIQGTLTTTNGNISFLQAITETGALTLNSGAGLGNIILSSTVNGTAPGAQDLTLTAGTGNITLSGNIGSVTRIGTFTINSAFNATASGTISANSITQQNGTGTTTFNGAVTTSTVSGIALTGSAFTLNNTVTTTTGAGPMTVSNAGLLTIGSGASLNIGGAFLQNGAGTSTLSGLITAGGAITFSTAVTLLGSPSLSAAVAGTNITFSSTINGTTSGADALTLNAGTMGNIFFLGNAGATVRLGPLVFTNANNITVQNITAASLHQVNGQGTSSYQGIDTNAIAGIVKNGTNFVRGGSIVTTNGGPLHVTNSGTLTTTSGTNANLSGQYLQDGLGPVIIQGTITTNSQPISFAGPMTLTGALVLNTTVGGTGGDITLSNTLDGAFDVTLTAGTGNVLFSQAIGGTTRVGNFVINSSGSITGTLGLTAASVNITTTGTTTFGGNVNTNTASGITIHAANIIRNGNATATNGGPLTAVFSGTSTGSGGTIAVGSLSVTCTGGAGIFFGGLVTTDTGGVDLHSPVTLLANGNVNTSAPGGTIHFYSTLQGAHNLTLNAGSGNVLFDGEVGTGLLTPIGALTITSANNVTASGGLSAASILQSAGSGTTTFGGAVTTTGASGISIATSNFTRGASIQTQGTGPLTFTLNPGGTLTSTAAGSVSVGGAFTETGALSVLLSGSITTANQNLSFDAPITMSGPVSLDTGAGAGNISVATIDGAQNLTLNAGTGSFTASGAIGDNTRIGGLTVTNCTNFTVQSITAASVNITESNGGTCTFNGNLNTNAVSGITINAANIVQGGNVNATNGGPLTLVFSGTSIGTGGTISVGSLSATCTGPAGIFFGGLVTTDTAGVDLHSPVTLLADASVNTSGPGGTIHFYDTLQGAHNLSLNAGAGNILFDGNVGSGLLTPLGNLTITAANNITALGGLSAAAIVQAAGTGKTTFSGAVSTTAVAGISLTGSQFELDGAVTTTNGGPLLINNSSTLALNGGGTISGALTQTGAGAVHLQGAITVNNLISFAAPVTLTALTSLDTSATGSNITFSSTVDGGQNLTLNLGAGGNLLFSGNVGGVTRLGALTITNANSVSLPNIKAASITQTAAATTSITNGLDTNAIGGISLSGSVMSISGNIVTISLGPVAIVNSGTLTLVAGAGTSISGAFSQSGGGGVNLSGTITTLGTALSFANPVGLMGAASLATGGGKITFSSTIDGNSILNLTAGAGDIELDGTIGALTSLGAFNVISCANISYPATTAGTVVQSASTGTTTINSPIASLGSGGISIQGTTITQSSSLTSSGTGSIAIINSSTYTMAGTVSSAAGFSQTGGGAVQLNGTVVTTNANLSFLNAITLTGNSLLTTSAGSIGNIQISSTIDGPFNLSLTADTASITLGGAVGSGTRIGVLTISSGVGNTTGAITAGSIIQLAGSTTFGVLNTNQVAGINLTGTSFTLAGNVTTTAAGPLAITNSGAVSLSGSTFSIAGAVNQTGLGTTTLSNAITSGGAIQFAGPLLISGNASLNTAVAGTNITLSNTVDGGGNLTLNAGMLGNITVLQDIGSISRLGAFVITNANNVTMQNVTASSLDQVNGQGTSVGGNINTNGASGIVINGNNVTRNGSVTTTNGGPLHITNQGLITGIVVAGINLDGAFIQDGPGPVNILGTITTNNQPISFAGPITLEGALVLNSGSGAGDITLSNTLDGAFDVTLTAGTGNVLFSQAIGGTTRIGNFVISSSASVTGMQGLTAASVDITTSGTSTLNGNVNTNTALGITLHAVNIVRGGSVTATNGGPLTAVFSGTSTGSGGAITVGSLDVTCTGPAGIFFGGLVTTDTAGVDLHSPVSLLADASVNTSGPGGTIHFYSTLQGAHNLTLNAGAGNVLFDGEVGTGLLTPLGALTITAADNVTASGGFSAASILQSSGSGTTTFAGAVTTTGASGISIATSNFTRGSTIQTQGTGPLTFTLNPGGVLTSTAAGSISVGGAFTETGASSVLLSGSITTANNNLSFDAPITMSGPVSLDTGAGAGDISVTTIDGAQNLTLNAGTGSFTASGAMGGSTRIGALTMTGCTNFTVQSITAASVNITESNGGTCTFNGNLNTNAVSGITINAANIVQGGNVNATNGGPLTLVFSGTSIGTGGTISVGSLSATCTGPAGIFFGGLVTTDTAGVDLHSPVTLLADASVNTSGPGGTIHFYDTLQGAHNLTVNAGAGNILFDGNVGSGLLTPLGNLTITAANNITASGGLSAAAIVQAAGTGKTTFSGTVSTTAVAGISLTGSQFEFDGAVTTTNGGPLAISHTGSLTIGSSAVMSLDGSFSESGGGSASIGANITTTNDPISWADAMTLTHDVTLNTGAGGGDITLGTTVNGPFCLTLLAGTGNVHFNGILGGVTPLNCLTATGASIIQNSSVATTSAVAYTGAIQLGGGITTANNDITLAGNVVLTNSATLSTGTGVGNISVTGTIDGNALGRNLVLTGGTGNVTLGGTIGGSVHLNNITISGEAISWANLGSTGIGATGTASLSAVTSITFTGTNYNNGAQLYTAGTSFIFNQAATLTSNNAPITFTTGVMQLGSGHPLTIVSNGGGGVGGGDITLTSVTVTDFQMTNLIVNANLSSLTFTQIGTPGNPGELDQVTLTAGSFSPTPILGTNVFAVGLTYGGPSSTSLTGAVTAPAHYTGPVILTGDVVFTYSPCPGAGAIIFDQSLDSDGTPRSMTINGCSNPVTFNGPVGGISSLASISIDSASDVNINSTMNVGFLAETNGTGTTTIASILDTTAAGGVNLQTSAITVTGGLVTTTGGNIIFQNSGLLTISGSSLELDGSFQQTGTGSVAVSGNITTTNDLISFASAVSLNGNLSLNSTGADITFNGTVDGTHNLDLTADAGSITFGGIVGGINPLSILTITTANNITANGAVSAASILQAAGTGKTTFSGAVSTTAVAGISLTGSQFEFDGAVTTTNGGPLLIHNSSTLALKGGGTISGALTQTGAGAVQLQGTTIVNDPISFAAPVTLTALTSLDTSATGSNITFSSTVDGGQNLTLNLGAGGNLLFTGNVGGSTRLGALTITNANSVAAPNITAASISQTAAATTSITSGLNTNAIGGIALTGQIISISGNIVTTALGPVAIVNSGPLTLAGGAGTSISGAFSQSGGGGVNLSGTITTLGTTLSFANPVGLIGTASLATGGGKITFSSTIDGSNILNLTAGAGDIELDGAIGSTTPLSAFNVISCANISYPATTALTVVQSASTGTTTINSPIASSGSGGISIQGTTITQGSSLTSSGTGSIAIINSGIYTMAGTVSSAAGFSQTGGGAIHLNGTVSTSNANLSFLNAITLTGNSFLTSTGSVGNGLGIQISSTIDGPFNLSLTAGADSITLGGAVGGSTRIGVLTINSGVGSTTGAITAGSIIQLAGSTTFGALNTNQLAGISLTGTSFHLAGNVTTTAGGSLILQNTGPSSLTGSTFLLAGKLNQAGFGTITLFSAVTASDTIQFAAPVIVSGTSSLNTSAAAKTITFLSTLNGPGSLTLNSGASDITLTGSAGATSPLGALTFTSARNISTQAISAASLAQLSGTGTTSITGNISTTGAVGINLTNVNININGSLISTNGGPCALSHTGLLTLAVGNSTLLAGPFSESGIGGTVILSGPLHASNANISFLNPITLAGSTTLNSDGGGDILISSTIDGPYDLIYNAGTGNITLGAAIGSISPVSSLTIVSANNVSTQAISSGYLNQMAGSGLTTFGGALTTTLSSGISLTGTQFTFSAPVSTSNGGAVVINNSDLLTMPASAPFTLSGAFSQLGTGAVSFCTSITTDGQPVEFTSPVSLCSDASVNTGSLSGNISFGNTVNGAHQLTLSAGQGNVLFSGAVGGITPLTLLNVTGSVNFTAGTLDAAAINISGVSGLASFNGPISTTGASGITLSGAAFTLNSNVTTSNAGPLTIANTGLLTIAPTLALSIDGAFIQSGSGEIQVGGSITTNAQNISFAGELLLTGDLSLSSGNGNITFGTDLDGPYSVTITAGTGDVTVSSAFSDVEPLVNFTVVSSHNISLNGMGTSSIYMSGTLSLNASNTISLMNTTYSAHTQYYTSGAGLNFINPGLITLNSNGGNITFASASAQLSSGTDLAINTNGGAFSFNAIHGTNFENLTINTGSGTATLGALPNIGNINTVIVNAGQIVLAGGMQISNLALTSLGSILNSGAPLAIASDNTASFNALGGNVGSQSSPILVNTNNLIYAGACSTCLADFNGTSTDNTVHPIPSNPPCIIIFNGIVIKTCTIPIPPSPPSPSAPAVVVRFATPLPGLESSYFNLSSDFYFLPFFLDENYIRKPVLMYWSSHSK